MRTLVPSVRRLRPALLLAAAALASLPTSPHAAEPAPAWSKADVAAAARLRDAALAGSRAYEVVTSLTTEVGPRPAGSAGDRAAVAWAAAKLRALGLENVRTEPVAVPHWVRGEAAVRILAPHPQALVACALGGSVGTAEEGLEAAVVAFPDLDALVAAPREQVAGRIVYLAKRMARSREGTGYGETVKGRVDGPAAAARQGALALVIRSVGTDDQRFAHTGTTHYADGVPRIPAFAISNPDADVLERELAGGTPVRLRLRSTARDLPPETSANVIGEVPGTDPAAGVVVLGAHLDSWDLGQGAIDDGAGVAIVSAAAALVRERGARPRRTLRVVLFANEEFGLSGGTEYARVHGGEPHAGALEADLGSGRVWKFSSHVRPDAVPAMRTIAATLRPLGIEAGGNDADDGADIGPLRERGVPVFALHQDASLYFDAHHTANDVLARVDRAALDQAVAAFAATAWLLAQAPAPLGPVPADPAPR
jgi:hypothetical protein